MKHIGKSVCTEPRQASGLFCKGPERGSGWLITLLLVLFAVPLLNVGCGPTSPRFKSKSDRPASQQDTTPRAESKEQEGETEAEEAEAVRSGTRSFRTEKNESISNLDQARMMRQISRWMGVPYKLGGETDEGLDCSAYTMLVYKNSIGKLLPRSSAEQFKVGTPVDFEDLKFGDLVFFNTTGESASHVGIYLGDDLFAHASISLGVTISSLESFYYKKRYEGARRIVD
jgi:cell wall-associated NlpC family hydrolase